jgi:hypothetical protein
VIKYYNLTQKQLKVEGNMKDPSFSDISEIIVWKLISIWNSASIPTISKTGANQVLKAKVDMYKKHIYKTKKENKKVNKNEGVYQDLVNEMRQEYQELFDKAACKCST